MGRGACGGRIAVSFFALANIAAHSIYAARIGRTEVLSQCFTFVQIHALGLLAIEANCDAVET